MKTLLALNAAPLPSPLGVLAGILSLLLVACSTSTENTVTLWEGDLVPVQAGGISGSVAAVSQFGRTQASIEIRGGEEGMSYGWRIASGTCESPGLIKGGAAVYTALTADEAGTASADVVLSAVFRGGSSLATTVFRSLAGGGGEEILACGELVER